MPKIWLIGAAVKPAFRHEHTDTHTPSSGQDVSPLSSADTGQLREKFKTYRGSGVIYKVFTENSVIPEKQLK